MHRMTAWPKMLHWLQVSRSTRPVTQVADVAVNREVSNPAECLSREAAGRFSSSVPSRIIPRKAKAMRRLMLIPGRLVRVNRFFRALFSSDMDIPSCSGDFR